MTNELTHEQQNGDAACEPLRRYHESIGVHKDTKALLQRLSGHLYLDEKIPRVSMNETILYLLRLESEM